MKKINLLSFLFLSISINLFSQKEESDLWLQADPHFYAEVKGESNGSIARIDITCSAEKIEDIKKEAIKSALYRLIFEGFEPGPNGEPSITALTNEVGLYQQKQADFDAYLNDPMQGMTKAQAKINPSKPGAEVKVGEKKRKLLKATFSVEVNLDNLRADLEGRKLIKPANQSSSGYVPNIVILPSDAWMKINRFHSTKDNQGIKVDIYNYKDALDNQEMKSALQEIKSKFEKNFKIIGYKDKLKEIDKEEAKNNALPVAKQASPLDIYAKTIAADIWIKIDISTKKINGGMSNQKMISIEAWNPFTGNNAFTGRQIDKETSGDNDWEVTKNAIREACDDIRPRFTDFFKSREENGIEGRVVCSISENAGDFNFFKEVDVKGKQVTLQKILESAIRKQTVKTKDGVSKMNPDGDQTETFLQFKDVYISPVIEEDEVSLDDEDNAKPNKVMASNNFGKLGGKIKDGLKKVGIECVIYQKGLGLVEIVITEKK